MITRSSSHFVRFFIVALLACATTFCVWKLDGFRQQSNQTKSALRWARQIATQAESLSLTASEKGEGDPLAWAARLLSQGTDSRIIFVSKFHAEDFQTSSKESGEKFVLDPNTGIFEYTKVIYPEDAMGIQVRLYTSRTGIFGAKTQLGHDSTVLAIFCISFSLLSWLLAKPSPAAAQAPLEVALQPPPFGDPLKPLVSEWVVGARVSLIDLSMHIREMTRSAAKLSTSAIEARDHVRHAQEKLQNGLVRAQTSPDNPNELTELASKVETVFKTLNPEAQELIRRLLAVSLRNAQAKEDLQVIAGDCEQAFHSLKNVGELALAVSVEIKQTTAGILGQSQLVAELKKQTA